MAALKRRLAIVRKDGRGSEYVFAGTAGDLPRKSNIIRRSFHPLLERAGIPEGTTFHQLRHTAASVLLLANTNPKVVAEMLGHSDVKTTLQTYSHVMPGLQRQGAEAMQRALGEAKRRSKKAAKGKGAESAVAVTVGGQAKQSRARPKKKPR